MVKYIPEEKIEALAVAFLKKYHPSLTLPIPVEEIIEFKLGIQIIPIQGLLSQYGIDAFLAQNMKELSIDKENFESGTTRARFSLAHEVGHFVLHQQYLKSRRIDSIKNWKEAILKKSIDHNFLEKQANLFAGYLLMPTDLLSEKCNQLRESLKLYPAFEGQISEDKIQVTFAAKTISKVFKGSEASATYRLIRLASDKKIKKRGEINVQQ